MYRTALARTHRPRRFDELVGQNHVASTLRAAVEGERVAHAYLFCGPRGVGKTTAARILAMALNCPERSGGEPCGVCDSCERIWSGGASLDVVEIDAASHRGVDDARDLRERAMYAPTSESRYKVYILDEAHMLTRDAWNALLKILEEPPARVIFAFATTEPRKIEQSAAPVLSRCQRFDFRRVAVPDIAARLEEVLRRENVEGEPGALLSIARRAEGGVRDALSLMDQVLSFAGDQVRAEDVRRMLGLVEEERYLELFGILGRRDRSEVFPFVQRLLDAGYDPAEFVRGLSEALRSLLILKGDPEGSALELLPDSRRRFAETARRFAEADLLRFLMAVSDFETGGQLRRSSQQRICLELLLLRLVSMDSAVEITELLSAAGGPPSPAARPPAESGQSVGKVSGESAPASTAERAGSSEAGSAVSRTEEAGPAVGRTEEAEPAASGTEEAGPAVGRTEEAEPAGRGTPPRPEPGEDLVALRRLWQNALDSSGSLGGQAVALRGARVEGFRDDTLYLTVPSGLLEDLHIFLSRGAASAALRESLARELSTGAERLEFEVREAEGGRLTAKGARDQRLTGLVEMDPRLREAVEKLDLTLKE
ncbi:MAG: DNA polymerase III subunit gamma/tau [Gemmatimonadota bacterium]